MKNLIKRYRPLVGSLRAGGLQVVDAHVHATDVMNVIDIGSYRPTGEDALWALAADAKALSEGDFESPDFLARLRHGPWRWRIERSAFSLLPGVVARSIRRSYALVGMRRMREEMDVSGVDAVVLLTVAPVAGMDDTLRLYGAQPDAHYLGSIDVQELDSDQVRTEVRRQMDLGAIGIKLHPNLQGFYPYPEDNPEPLSVRLHETYAAAEDFGLYVQLHAGMSNLLPAGHQTRRHAAYAAAGGQHFGLFDHYCDEQGRSRLFERYRCRFVLAHMGRYGAGAPDPAPIVRLAERYPNVHFDTSNCPPGLIADFTRASGASRLLFGSDGLYNRQVAELVNCLEGLEKGSRSGHFEENAAAVLGQNFAALRRETGRARSGARSRTSA